MVIFCFCSLIFFGIGCIIIIITTVMDLCLKKSDKLCNIDTTNFKTWQALIQLLRLGTWLSLVPTKQWCCYLYLLTLYRDLHLSSDSSDRIETHSMCRPNISLLKLLWCTRYLASLQPAQNYHKNLADIIHIHASVRAQLSGSSATESPN